MMMWTLSLAFLWIPCASIRIGQHSENFEVPAAASSTSTKDKNLAEMLCSNFRQPKIAICLHSAARSFPHTLVHTSAKKNLVEALGADSTLFMHVTRKDARADPRPGFDAIFADHSEEHIRAAAENVLGIPPARMKIMEGPNMELPSCPNYNASWENRRKHVNHPTSLSGHHGSMEYLYSLAGQLSHKEGCMKLIREHEKSTNTTFDSVILARADLTYYKAMPAYCMFDHRKPRRFWDWYYHVPREQADGLFSEPYRRFYECKQDLPKGQKVEEYVWKNILHPDPVDDGRLPIMVTRNDDPKMPNNLCDMFRFNSEWTDEVSQKDLCGPMTYKNAFNSLPGKENQVQAQ